MKEEKKEKIINQIEADNLFLEEFKGALEKETGGSIPVIELNTNMSAEFVFVKLIDKLKEFFQMRPALIEKQ